MVNLEFKVREIGNWRTPGDGVRYEVFARFAGVGFFGKDPGVVLGQFFSKEMAQEATTFYAKNALGLLKAQLGLKAPANGKSSVDFDLGELAGESDEMKAIPSRGANGEPLMLPLLAASAGRLLQY